jgi:hypothetical protein
VTEYLTRQISADDAEEFHIADFASGENDKIPNFIHRVLPDFIPELDFSARRIITYSPICMVCVWIVFLDYLRSSA